MVLGETKKKLDFCQGLGGLEIVIGRGLKPLFQIRLYPAILLYWKDKDKIY